MDYNGVVSYLSTEFGVMDNQVKKSLLMARSLRQCNLKKSTYTVKPLALKDATPILGKVHPVKVFKLMVYNDKKRRGIIIYTHRYVYGSHERYSVSTVNM